MTVHMRKHRAPRRRMALGGELVVEYSSSARSSGAFAPGSSTRALPFEPAYEELAAALGARAVRRLLPAAPCARPRRRSPLLLRTVSILLGGGRPTCFRAIVLSLRLSKPWTRRARRSRATRAPGARADLLAGSSSVVRGERSVEAITRRPSVSEPKFRPRWAAALGGGAPAHSVQASANFGVRAEHRDGERGCFSCSTAEPPRGPHMQRLC